MSNQKLTISALNNYIKHIINSDTHLKRLVVVGEVSNYRPHHSGHMYFTLKDEESRIDCVMFKSQASKVSFDVKNGDKVVVGGYLDVYPASGKYQLYAQTIELDGLGDLHKKFELLKVSLEKEGLFNSEHKKALPTYPTKIGVITATTGAAIRDIVSTIEKRFPVASLSIFNTVVQGAKSKDSIIKSLDMAVEEAVDVIIIGRGGGSIEDLWSFNEEDVVRKLFSIDIPIVSGVGHETDFTLTDFVADVRGQTPTSAATLATPDKKELIEKFNNLDRHMKSKLQQVLRVQQMSYVHQIKNLDDSLEKRLVNAKNKYDALNTDKLGLKLLQKIEKNKVDFENIKNRIDTGINYKLKKDTTDFSHLVNMLENLSPLKVLSRGYSVSYSGDKIVKSVDDIKDDINIILSDGDVKIKIAEKEVHKNE